MGARHALQQSAVWTSESAVILLAGIEANEHGERLAEARLRALHPLSGGKIHHSSDFEKRLRKAFESGPVDRVQPWLAAEFWQQEVDNVLVQGIFGRSGARSNVVDRIQAVWPNLCATWLRDRMEEVARAGLPQWSQNDFWAVEVDPILLVGIDRANRFRSEAVDKVLKTCPELRIDSIRGRVRALRNQNGEPGPGSLTVAVAGPTRVGCRDCSAAMEMSNCPGCSGEPNVWKTADPILLGGIRKANQCERAVVDKVLAQFAELRIGAIWARIRRLRYRQKPIGPLPWTNELDERLRHVYGEAGLSASVSEIQNLTGWPRRSILRRAHKLGLPARPTADRRRWTMAEFRFAIESVNHISVREIATELERSEKAVWGLLEYRGIPARFESGHSVRELATKLHVRRPSIRMWIKAGLLHKKRNGRISEDSLQSFLYTHPERINWALLDEDTTYWVSELLEAERIRVSGSGLRTSANSRRSEDTLEARASNSHGTASSTLVADPCEDLVSHRDRARGASPRQ
jgi:hypothetical protein